MNFEQIKGIVERVATVVLTYLVAKDYVPSAISADLVAGAVLLVSIIWGWKVNTPASLSDAAKATK